MGIYTILNIDGGGIKGVYTINILNKLEEEYCKPNNKLIGDYFNVISGTSTGGIIGIAIACKIPMNKLLEIYINKSNELFHDYGYKDSCFNISNILYNYIYPVVWGYRYNTKKLKQLAETLFKTKTIDELTTNICIPAYNTTTNKCEFFKNFTDTCEITKAVEKIKLVDVVLATTAAPTYFKQHTIKHKGNYIDGGIFANDPTLINIIETNNIYQIDKADQYEVLSIGNIKNEEYNNKITYNLLNFPKLVDVILNANIDNDSEIITHLKKQFNFKYVKIECNIINIDIDIDKKYIKMDNINKTIIKKIVELSNIDYIKYKQNEIIQHIFNKKD